MASYYGWVKVNVSSYDSFRSAVLGNGYDVDNAYGFQCYDGAAVQLYSATGRKLSTGGTGAARGCWEVVSARNYNAGSEYELITDKTQIKRGDIIVWSMNSKWGHIGFADQDYNGNYIKVLGQNQVGDGSGYPFTIANISLATFLGAFRYKNWKNVGPSPTPKPSPSKVIVPTGVTIAALAAALGLSIPQLLAGDPNDPNDNLPQDTPIDKPLDDETAKKAAENAKKAKEAKEGKTTREMAVERCEAENKKCEVVTVEKWDGTVRTDGTIWTICGNHSNLNTADCTNKTIQYNHEDLEINAAEHNVIQSGGHWIFPGDSYVIPTE